MNPAAPTAIRYRIDAENRLIYCNEAWGEFASENDGGALAAGQILGQNLFSCIADATLCQLYLQLVDRARNGTPVQFTFRCDGPGRRRWFEMEIRAGGDGEVEFSSTLRKIEERPAVLLLAAHQARDETFLCVCSWCQRTRALEGWLTVEEVVEKLDLMHRAVLPRLTHGICEACHARMLALIDRKPS